MYIAYQTSRKLCTILVDNHIIPPENSKYYLYCFEFVFDNILFNAFLFLLAWILGVLITRSARLLRGSHIFESAC